MSSKPGTFPIQVHPALRVFQWNTEDSDTENFEALIQTAVQEDRNKLLIAGCSADQSCLVISLLALGRGFDVYVCGDLIEGPEEEKNLLIGRLRQQGAVVVSKRQIITEFSATLRVAD